MFEHLFLDGVRSLLREIKRIMKTNAACRTVVPDLALIVKNYDSNNPKPFINAIYEIGKRSDVKNAHHSAYTVAFLIRLFEKAEFSTAYVCQHLQGRCPDLELLDNRPEISLIVEAIK